MISPPTYCNRGVCWGRPVNQLHLEIAEVYPIAAEDTYGESHFSQSRTDATGLAKGLATVIAAADPIAALTPNSINQVAIAALLTKKNQTADQYDTSTTAVGSQLTGGRIDIQSGRDALVKGEVITSS